MTDLDPAVVERMVALVRSARALPPLTYPPKHPIGAFFNELDAIAALLPEPVDPDLLEARELIADAVLYGAGSYTDPLRVPHSRFRKGDCDTGDLIQRAMKLAKRGQLAREGGAG